MLRWDIPHLWKPHGELENAWCSGWNFEGIMSSIPFKSFSQKTAGVEGNLVNFLGENWLTCGLQAVYIEGSQALSVNARVAKRVCSTLLPPTLASPLHVHWIKKKRRPVSFTPLIHPEKSFTSKRLQKFQHHIPPLFQSPCLWNPPLATRLPRMLYVARQSVLCWLPASQDLADLFVGKAAERWIWKLPEVIKI